MNNKINYAPGPTETRENVRLIRAEKTTNPDIDVDFVEFYKKTCEKFGNIVGTKNDIYILSGEGILGLEAACASLTEKGDRVLVIDNGIYGEGFKDFVKMYGGEYVLFSSQYTKSIDVDELRKFLEKDNNFKYATVVHCDTPTGVLNDVSEICPLLKEYGILTVVDSVAGMVGERLNVDESKIDVILGGSQKAISAPAGLTIVGISQDAKNCIKNRKTDIVGFYCNLSIWEGYYEKKYFPYTMPISDIMGLDRALDNILEEGVEKVLSRHEKIASSVRQAVEEYGLELFLEEGYSNTVTAIKIPESIGALKLTDYMLKNYNTLVATSLNQYMDAILRIGHMGENASLDKIVHILNVLDKSLKALEFNTNGSLVDLFNKYYF
ncbi:MULTISPECIES: pyridoxal-phosphate-dependent aminotransferase family protein [unclassified Clostridioides]|uniref:pyridoxal-phosphate-dependent aminotransferase family protein n=1 Tax=unclassified Clostridioides TaxID=2635829 RepID=UPI001D0CCE3D|nr:alanine--glyoxylate aminotransferase family protein [Clostridioides sp. ES-S-0001-02]MCC0639245.1 alanine--glyoxylate aminotransferase family protein [Clostridioides sp. ES-S-0049-03]MCC0652986.1 alanine--glyoxylate aminotransferase family protein [Clostridioides sp. ES-S-0001-03]MCC0657030.1 alanine--glyoxylate aminotransferase family protein [Clostridioides sp. ES-S-0123-01]MCC0675635.1 alanine--glyoxylate aminotransferase family protein [Clostridioides sp. ES-W-0018-02]MCC0707562.1 alani